MTARIAPVSALLLLLATAACGQTQPLAEAPEVAVSAAFDGQVHAILEDNESSYGPEAQWEGVQMLDAMSDVDAREIALPALEQACLDGRGQEIASLLGTYVKKVGRGAPCARKHAAQQIVAQCGVQDWEARSERLGFVETAPGKFSLASERRVIDSLLLEANPPPQEANGRAVVAGR